MKRVFGIGALGMGLAACVACALLLIGTTKSSSPPPRLSVTAPRVTKHHLSGVNAQVQADFPVLDKRVSYSTSTATTSTATTPTTTTATATSTSPTSTTATTSTSAPPHIIYGMLERVPFMQGGNAANVVEQQTASGRSVWIVPGPGGICIATASPPRGFSTVSHGYFGVCDTSAHAAESGVEAVFVHRNGSATVTGIVPVGNTTVDFGQARGGSVRTRTVAHVRYNLFSVAVPKGDHWETLRSAKSHKLHTWRIN